MLGGASQRHHSEAVQKRAQAGAVFMRRAPAGNEVDGVETKRALRRSGHGEVSVVDRIEGTAEQANSEALGPPRAALAPPRAGLAIRGGEIHASTVAPKPE